jgi:hypothetical protein
MKGWHAKSSSSVSSPLNPDRTKMLRHLEPRLYLRVEPKGPIFRSGLLRNQLHVIGMRADPEPKDIVATYFAERSVIQTYSY